jgi:hypothetical protein
MSAYAAYGNCFIEKSVASSGRFWQVGTPEHCQERVSWLVGRAPSFSAADVVVEVLGCSGASAIGGDFVALFHEESFLHVRK